MTVLSAETRLIGTGASLLPRVNLLPPEIAEKRAFRRVQLGLGAAVVATLGVVGLVYVGASHSVTSASDDLQSAQSQQSTLQAESAKYRNVTAIYAAADNARAQLASAMGDEVRYSQLLNDLSLSIPSNVWVKSIGFAAAAPGAATATLAGASSALAPVAQFTMSGVAFSHDDVAQWLDAIAGLKTYDSPYFSSSTESLMGPRKVVNFTSTANVTPQALSGRYKPNGG